MKAYSKENLNFLKKDSVCTKAEIKLYDILSNQIQNMYPNQYIVLPQVSLYEIVKMPKFNWSNFWRIKSKCIDFVICKKETLKPIYAVELQDDSHKKRERKKRDTLLEDIFENAWLKFAQVIWYDDQQSIKDILNNLAY